MTMAPFCIHTSIWESQNIEPGAGIYEITTLLKTKIFVYHDTILYTHKLSSANDSLVINLLITISEPIIL